MAVALDSAFWATLPAIPTVAREEADMAWLVYDLARNETENRFTLTRSQTIYTRFDIALDVITRPEAGDLSLFVRHLQRQLDVRLEAAPINAVIEPPFLSEDADAIDT